jgi:Holliday junction DNA helicase RuvB
VDTLVDMVEPFLLKEGLLARTRKGRRATVKAYDYLGVKLKENQPKLFSNDA